MLAPIGLTRCFLIRSKNVRSFNVNSGNRDLLNNFHTVFPNTGPRSQPIKAVPTVNKPIDAMGSMGMSLVTSSAMSGCVDKNVNVAAVTARDETMLEARE